MPAKQYKNSLEKHIYMEKPKYNLYLASGITIWKEHFKPKYSDYFNNKLNLFEPGTLKIPDKHDLIPISVALKCIDKIDHSNGILVFMENYKTLDGSPTGTDSAWEVGYGVAKQKPVILFIDDKSSFDYYSLQWMVTFSVGAIITTDPEVLEILTLTINLQIIQ